MMKLNLFNKKKHPINIKLLGMRNCLIKKYCCICSFHRSWEIYPPKKIFKKIVCHTVIANVGDKSPNYKDLLNNHILFLNSNFINLKIINY